MDLHFTYCKQSCHSCNTSNNNWFEAKNSDSAKTGGHVWDSLTDYQPILMQSRYGVAKSII